jgi:dCMP deaminase
VRPTIDEAMLNTAWVWAMRSTCTRLAVGAVLARDDRVLSTGYNGAPTGLDHCVHEDEEPCSITVHAEANALLFAGRHGASTLGTTMYCTHAPCLGCSGLLLNAGVARVVYQEWYRSDLGLERLSLAGVKVEKHG